MIAKLVLASAVLLATGATAYALCPFCQEDPGPVFVTTPRGETEESHPFGCPKASRQLKVSIAQANAEILTEKCLLPVAMGPK